MPRGPRVLQWCPRCVIRAQRWGSNPEPSCSLHCSPRYLPLVGASHLTIAMLMGERTRWSLQFSVAQPRFRR
jgi:hypothetical protein